MSTNGADELQQKGLDEAISVCDSYIDTHRKQGRLILLVLLQVSVVLIALLGYFIWLQVQASGIAIESSNLRNANINVSSAFTNSVIFALLAIFVIVFGVVMAVYRFHLNEISKAEHYKIGFLRIRIAANNDASGFQSEVRMSLTDKAFTFDRASGGGFSKGKRVESPLPGHPTTDISAILLGKLLERFEAKEEKRA